MKEESKITECKSGKISYPWWWIMSENILFLLNWGIGFILLIPFKYREIPVVALIYLIVLIAIQILLKKHNCSNCYYYGKWCHLGWGKVARLLFKKSSGSLKVGIKLSISYILQLPVIAILAIIAGFIYGFDLFTLILLVIFIAINIFQGTFLRKKACILCKARFTCPGSAIKQNL